MKSVNKNMLCQLLIFMLLTLKLAHAGVVIKPHDDSSKESYEEVDDLLTNNSNKNNSQEKISPEDKPYAHHDEDQLGASENLKNLNFDVELVESSEVKKETNEVEEQFRGTAALKTNVNFNDENIEMNVEVKSQPILKESHVYTSILLLILAILSISIYAILVLWRAHLEQRYGMRELLITDDFDEYYRQQQQSQDNYTNNNNNHNNNNNNYNHDDANNNSTMENNMRQQQQQQQSYLVQA